MVADNSISAVLVSTDLERSRGFYEDKVGLKLSPGVGRSAWFKDPDGNTIALFQPE